MNHPFHITLILHYHLLYLLQPF